MVIARYFSVLALERGRREANVRGRSLLGALARLNVIFTNEVNVNTFWRGLARL